MKQKSFLKNKSFFRIAFLTNVFFFSVHFLQYVSYVAVVLLILWGIGLVIRDIAKGTIKKTYFFKFFAIFLSLGVLSHVVNLIADYGEIFPTIVGLVLLASTAIFMFLFIPNTDTKKGVLGREMFFVANVYFYSSIIINVIGIILLFVFKTELGERIIIYDNRFVGAYINPNMGAFCCFLSVVSGLLLTNKKFCVNAGKKVLDKRICFFGMLINYICIAISDSKGALLALTTFVIFCSVFSIYKAKTSPRKRHIISAIVSVVMIFVCLFGVVPCQKLMSSVVNSESTSTVALAQSVNEQNREQNDGEVTFDHESEKEKNGGGRTTLWKQCIKFFEQKPLLGWGAGNLLLMGDKTEANTIDNMKIDLGAKLFEAHNGYLTLLASSGVLGFLTFASFILILLAVILKNTFLKVKHGGIGKTVYVTSCVIALLVYALVEPSLVYYPSLVVTSFWFFMGLSIKWATENERLQLTVPTQKAIGHRLYNE